MQTGAFFRLVRTVRGECSGWSSGSSILWAIGALVVLGLVGAGIAVMTPSATQSKLEQEAGMRAYYNANAGLNFVMSMQNVAQSNKTSFSNYMSMMGDSGVVSYNVEDDGYFAYQLGNIVTNGVNGTYQITDLSGTVMNSSGGSAYGYVIFGGGKGSSHVFNYNVSSMSNTNGRANDVLSGSAVTITASSTNVTGNIYAKNSVSVANDTIINGNVVSNGSFTGASRTSVSGYVCADGDVSLASSSIVSGDINAGGDVTLESASKVGGSIYSGGTVTLKSESVVVTGNIHAAKYIYLNSKAAVGGNVYAGVSVVYNDSSVSVGGDANSQGTVSFLGYGGTVSGNVYSSGAVTFSGKTTVAKNVYSGSSINFPNWTSSCINGVAAATGAISTCSGASCGSGNCYIHSSLPSQPSVTSPTAPVSHTSCAVKPDPDPPYNRKTTDGVVNLASGASYYFSGKTYYFSSITGAGNNTLYFDLSGGDVTIFSTGDVNFNGKATIKVSLDGKTYKNMGSVDKSYAAKVYLESNGNMYMGWAADWFGTLFSRGTLTFNGGNTIIGSYASLGGVTQIVSGSGYTVVYVASTYALANW